MRKFRKKLVWVIMISIMLPMFATLTSKGASNESLILNTSESRFPLWESYKNWMSDAWPVIKDTRYCDMVLIGTHDSGTYNLSYYDGMQIEEGLANTLSTINKFPGVRDIVNDVVRQITHAKSVTQDTNIYNQLMEGNRFLDLRLKKFNGDGKYRTFHGMFGDDLQSIVSQIEDFIRDTDSREIVYVNFNQFGFMWDMSAEEKVELGRLFREALGEYIFTPEEFDFTYTMEQLAASGKRLVVHAIEEVADGVQPTLREYTIPQAQHGSQLMEEVVIPNLTTQYNENYRTVTDQERLNQWYQMKVQYSWVASEDLDPVIERLKKVDLVGGIETLDRNLTKTLRDFTNESRTAIYDFMLETGSGANENQPNVWLRDFYNDREVAIAIMRNFGKNTNERFATTQDIFNKVAENPYDEEMSKALSLIQLTRRVAGELEGQFASYQFESIETPYYGGHGGDRRGRFEFIPSLLSKPKVITIQFGDRVNGIELIYDNYEMKTAGSQGSQKRSLTLENDEYVTRIDLNKGNRNGVESIHRIKFYTNKGRTLEGGTRTGNAKTFTAPPGWYMFAMLGEARLTIDKIAFGFRPIPGEDFPYQKADAVGMPFGQVFDTSYGVIAERFSLGALVGHTSREHNMIQGLTLDYGDTFPYRLGNTDPGTTTSNRLDLQNGEYIKEAKIYQGRSFIFSYVKGVTFVTNRNRTINIGDVSGNAALRTVAPEGWKVEGFYGNQAQNAIFRLGFYLQRME